MKMLVTILREGCGLWAAVRYKRSGLYIAKRGCVSKHPLLLLLGRGGYNRLFVIDYFDYWRKNIVINFFLCNRLVERLQQIFFLFSCNISYRKFL